MKLNKLSAISFFPPLLCKEGQGEVDPVRLREPALDAGHEPLPLLASPYKGEESFRNRRHQSSSPLLRKEGRGEVDPTTASRLDLPEPRPGSSQYIVVEVSNHAKAEGLKISVTQLIL